MVKNAPYGDNHRHGAKNHTFRHLLEKPFFLSFPQSLNGNPEGSVVKKEMNSLIRRRIRSRLKGEEGEVSS